MNMEKIMMNRFCFLCLVLLFSFQLSLCGQPAERLVEVIVTPDHADWLYKLGDKVKFNVAVLRCNVPLDGIELNYEVSEDMMPPHLTGKVRIDDKTVEIKAGSMKKEGFLRCKVMAKYRNRVYEGLATVGFSPEKLCPVTSMPADFDAFWMNKKETVQKQPLEPVMTLVPEKCTDKVNVYHVSFINTGGASRMYGMLCIPKAEGSYPAILKVPGAGMRAYHGEIDRASKGFIILEIGIHGMPVNLPGEVYHRLYNGALKNYHSFNMSNREEYYYKRVYLGCVRAIDFIYSLPQFNGNLATFGGSQGGALSIVTAGLDSRVKGLVAFYPALCDMAGYAHGRAGGWPHMFKNKQNCTPDKLNTIQYYDVVNFAHRVKVPGFYTFGYNDCVCPPTTTYSAYNMIKAPKELFVAETTGHYAYSEQWSAAWNWVMAFLKNESEVK